MEDDQKFFFLIRNMYFIKNLYLCLLSLCVCLYLEKRAEREQERVMDCISDISITPDLSRNPIVWQTAFWEIFFN